jgi:GR25 family glycosyltransferase involved in LPS biosynthesis
MSTSIVLTIYNQEKIIKDVMLHLFDNSSIYIKEYIFVLDGCSDNSEEIVKHTILNHLPANTEHKLLYANNVFETKANNIALRAVTQEYAIIVQDDMCIKEKNWDTRLTYPIKKYNDVWGVTARTALNFEPDTHAYLDSVEGPVGHRYKQFSFPRNEFMIRSFINRGPLAIHMPKLLEVGLFDEDMPGVQGFDDTELAFRMLKLKGWKCGTYWINYESRIEWGKTRASYDTSIFFDSHHKKNMTYVVSKYGRDLINSFRIQETRIIDECEYAHIPKKRIALHLIATNKYTYFLDNLCQSVDKYFFPIHDRHVIIYTNMIHPLFLKNKYPNLNFHFISIKHENWPNMTLKRFHFFEKSFNTFDRDYDFYCDVDAKFVNVMKDNLLNTNITFTDHPQIRQSSFNNGGIERNPNSTAYISSDVNIRYVCGGFFGGPTSKFIELSNCLVRNIDSDLSNNIIAIQHDESHINWYAHRYNCNHYSFPFATAEGISDIYPTTCINFIEKQYIGGHDYFRNESVTIVTASSDNHFQSVCNLIRSIPIYVNTIFYDIGLSNNNIKKLNTEFPNIHIRTFDFSKYPKHVSLSSRDAGAYAWKPIIIDEVYTELSSNNVLMWCDAGNILNNDIGNCINIIKTAKIYSALSSGNITRWTHPTSIQNLQMPSEYLHYNMRNAAFVGLVCNDTTVKSFVNEWKSLSLNKEIILPAGANRSNHRHDQSILTYLYYKYNIPNVDNYIGYSLHNDVDLIEKWNFVDKVAYINLDNRLDRNEHMKIMTSTFGNKVTRFSAIKTQYGAIGCTLSHIFVLKTAIRENYENILILEDDADWNNFEHSYKILEELASMPYDVIMLGGSFVSYDSENFKLNTCQTTTGYLVNKHYMQTLVSNFEESVLYLSQNPTNECSYALDMYWHRLQRQDNWLIVQPPLVYQKPGYSDICRADVDYRCIMNVSSEDTTNSKIEDVKDETNSKIKDVKDTTNSKIKDIQVHTEPKRISLAFLKSRII